MSILLDVIPNLEFLHSALKVASLAEGEHKCALIINLITICVIEFYILHVGARDVVRLSAFIHYVKSLYAKFFLHLTINKKAGHFIITLNSEFYSLSFGDTVVKGIEITIALKAEFAFLGV